MISEFYEFTIHRKLMKSNETRIKRFGVKIKEISYFQNQKKFESKLGEIEEHNDLKCKIKNVNLI